LGEEGGKKILADTQVPTNTGKISSGKLTFLSVLTYAQHQIYGEIKMYCLLFIIHLQFHQSCYV